MTKIQKLRRKLNDEFRDHLAKAATQALGVEVVTEYAFLADALITRRVDGKKLTKKQRDWLAAFESGYTTAMKMVRE